MVKRKPTLTELVGEAPERRTYEFNVDSEEVLDQKGEVVFWAVLKDNVNPNAIKSTLESMSADVGYATYKEHLGILICVTNQATYERIFQTELELDRLKRGQAGYTPEGYRQLKPATIPSELSDKVYEVHLSRLHK